MDKSNSIDKQWEGSKRGGGQKELDLHRFVEGPPQVGGQQGLGIVAPVQDPPRRPVRGRDGSSDWHHVHVFGVSP